MKSHSFARGSNSLKQNKHITKKKLSFEWLEDRTLLSASLPAGVDFHSLVVDPNSFDSSSILVRYKDGAATTGKALGLVSGLHEVFLTDGMDVTTALEHYKADPNVIYVQPNYRVSVNVIPNDPMFASLYGLHNTGTGGGTLDADIDAPEAWDTFTGDGSVVVAVIDTGIDYTHPDLLANIWTNSAEIVNGLDDDNNGVIDDIHGANFVDPLNPTGDPFDDHGHGTHVAGTIGAVGNNGTGVVGVLWDVQLMGVKFLDAGGGGSTAGAISALNYAVQMGATISNNSWGGGGPDQMLQQAIANAAAQNHIFVAAAGNDSNNNDINPFFPAGYDLDNVISVAATDNNDQLAYFSNYGANTVDLGAPGVNILSTVPASGALGDPSRYGTLSGTSMATPHVTGVVALVRNLHPTWTYQQVIAQVLGRVDPINSLQGKTITGGRLNAAGAATGTPPADTNGARVTTSSPSGSLNGSVSSVRFTFSEAIDPTSFTTGDIVSFTGPSGTLTASGVAEVAGSAGRQFDITFAEQNALGPYGITIGPDIRDLAQNPMNQDRDAINAEIPDDQYTASFTLADVLIYQSTDVPAPILDYTITISYLTVSQDVYIGDLNVELSLTHTYDGDLYIHLISPTGYDIPLAMNRGGAGQNFTGTIFDDEAALPISSGSAPFTGSYQPESPLSQLDGQSLLGTWQLWIEDWYGFDEGTLLAWSLMVQPGTPPPPPPPPNQPPDAVDDTAITNEDQPVTIAVLANDTDPEGGALTITSIDYVDGGAATITPDNKIIFTPTPDYYGAAWVMYTISDPAANTDSAWVYIDVLPVPDVPVAVNDQASADMNTPLVFDGWYGNPDPPEYNDTDADGDYLYLTGVGNAVNGTVEFDAYYGIVTFTPDTGFLGTASFTYTVTDGTYSATGTVTVDVKAFYYLSLAESGTIGGVSFTDADILQLTIGGGGQYSYSMYFDGSLYGLTTASEDIDAFDVLPDGTILLSTVGSFTVPQSGGGKISGNGEDLILWNPWDQRFTFYFDGSDVGLSGSSENIDGVAMLDDGTLLISTTGAVKVPGVSGQDEDLLVFTPWALGTATSGTWAMYFDGSDVGLATNDSEDIDAVFVETTSGLPNLYFSTIGNFAVSGASGANEDTFRFRPTTLGPVTAGVFGPGLRFDGSLYGLASFNVDGIHIGRLGSLLGGLSLGSGNEDAGTSALPEPSVLDAVPFAVSAPQGATNVLAPADPAAAAQTRDDPPTTYAPAGRTAIDRIFSEIARSTFSGDDLGDPLSDVGPLAQAFLRLKKRGR